MSALATPARRSHQMSLAADLVRRDAPEAARPRRQPIGCSDGGRPTLEAIVSGAGEGLHAAGVADCPVCGGELRRAGEASRCSGCGSALS